MAIMLGFLVLLGIQPGPDMLTKNLAVTYSMVWSIAIANILGSGLCYIFSSQFARIASLRYSLILPVVLVAGMVMVALVVVVQARIRCRQGMAL